VLGLCGFSINMLTMFAMVLAIGLLVDDAIVVVENVERIMSEEGLSPLEATRKSMDQITSALIGIGLVLSAVFGPMMFFPGSTGVIYRQFSVTIIAALVLTPVLCATFLKPVEKGHEATEGGVWFLRPFFRWFDGVFFQTRNRYLHLVGQFLSHKFRYVVVFLVIVVAMGFLFKRMPTGYLPDEDQGILMIQAMLPANSTLEQTEKVMDGVQKYFWHELRRQGTERGHGLHQAQGLETPRPCRFESRSGGRKGHDGIFQDSQRDGVCLCAAGGHRTGPGERV
jgi:HAE1 family hydrophobic/amphiphilic exporter-1